VILDNYSIHISEEVTLTTLEIAPSRRFALHFLPPYCPDQNNIDRAWHNLHANVTRNHNRTDMFEVMKNVRHYLKKRNRQKAHFATGD